MTMGCAAGVAEELKVEVGLQKESALRQTWPVVVNLGRIQAAQKVH